MTRQEKIITAEEGIKELKSNIDDWEDNNDCFIQFQNIVGIVGHPNWYNSRNHIFTEYFTYFTW